MQSTAARGALYLIVIGAAGLVIGGWLVGVGMSDVKAGRLLTGDGGGVFGALFGAGFASLGGWFAQRGFETRRHLRGGAEEPQGSEPQTPC